MESIARRALLCLCSILAVPSAAAAQGVVMTAVGRAEVVAVAVDRSSGTVYYATDRPGAIYKKSGLNGPPSLVAGIAGGSIASGGPAAQTAVFPVRNGLAVDSGGNLFFSEPSLHRIRRIDAATGVVTTIGGTGVADRPDPRYAVGNNAIYDSLPAPAALAFNPLNGDLMVADESWDIVYRLSTNGGGLISGGNAILYLAVGGNPSNLAIYVDFEWYNPFGYAGDGGPAKDAKLNHPRGLAFDGAGNLYIADSGNHVVRRVDTAGTITTIAGNGAAGYSGSGGQASAAQLFLPAGVAVDSLSNLLLIADTSNQRVRSVDLTSGTIADFAGDGQARLAASSFAFPTGVAVFDSQTVIIADSQNRSVVAAASGTPATLTEIANVRTTGDSGYVGNGAPGGDAINNPQAVVFDTAGNMFFSDSGNARVRRMDSATHQLTTVVGNGIPGYAGDGGQATAAMLNCPAGLAFGPAGSLFITDPCASVVRKVSSGADVFVKGDSDEIITTVAGTGIRYGNGYGNEGLATSARLNHAEVVTVDSTGQFYVGEKSEGAIRRVSTDGIIHDFATDIGGGFAMMVDPQDHLIFAGGGISCDDHFIVLTSSLGLGSSFSGIALDALGRLYLTDSLSRQYVVQLAPTSGTLCSATQSTIRASIIGGDGSGTIGYSGDGGPATAATFNSPVGVAVDPAGNVAVADAGNDVIRLIQQPTVGVTLSVASLDFGAQGLQLSSTEQTVTATVTGTAAATFGAATLSGANTGDFIITTDGCNGKSVPTVGSCQIGIVFKATARGQRSAILQVNDNAANSPQTVTLSGIGASLAVSPAPLAFGSQSLLSASAPVLVTVTNQATAQITVGSLSLSGTNFQDYQISSDTCSSVTLGAQASCTFSVTFTPQAVGPSSATLTIASSADTRTVGLSGTGIMMVPAASATPSSIAFGNVAIGNSTSGTTLTLRSTGTAPLQVTSVSLTGNQPVDFSLSGDTCSGATLAPSQACTITVSFRPQEICSSTAMVMFADNASDSPQTVFVSGQGTAGPGGAFTATLFCTSHAAQPRELAAGADGNVWFDEGGSAFSPAAIARANAQSGVVKEDPTVILPGWKPSGLTFAPNGSYAYIEARGAFDPVWLDIVGTGGVRSPTSYVGPLALGPDNGFWLARRFTCADLPLVTDFSPKGVTTDYTPTAQWIYANTNGHVCLAPSTAALGPEGALWIGSTRQSPDPIPTPPNGFVRVARDGGLIDFTATDAPPLAAAVGADGNMYTLVSTGTTTCGLERIDALGQPTQIPNDPSVVALGCSSLVAGPDHRLWMTGLGAFNGTAFPLDLVAFDPMTRAMTSYPTPQLGFIESYLTAGPDEGIWFDAVPSAVGRFDIGGGSSRAFVTPGLAGFASTSIGIPSGWQVITVRSTGTTSLAVSSVALTGADATEFQYMDGCGGVTLPPGSTCSILVTSKPTRTGSHSAMLVISDSDGFSPQTVRLEEYTVPKPPTASPSPVSFPSTNVGQQSSSKSVSLTNNGDRPLHVMSVSLGGADFADFHVHTDNCSNTDVPVAGKCTVVVQFTPQSAGAKSATLTFTDAANPPTQTVTLSGAAQSTSGGGGGSTGGSCACSMTGTFVDPALKDPDTSLTSSNGIFTVTVSGPQYAPTHLAINKSGSSVPIVNIDIPPAATWDVLLEQQFGFSPDGNRFVVHYQSIGLDWMYLYDLTSSSPANPVWHTSLPINTTAGANVTSPSGAIAFSPHGNYLVATQLQTQSSTDQQIFMFLVSSSGAVVPSPIQTWTPSSTPKGDEAVHSAHWGFSPDDQTFAMVLDRGLGPYLELISLPTGTLVQEVGFTPASWYVQFSPCGDALGVISSGGSSATADLYSTKAADARRGPLGEVGSLPAVEDADHQVTITMNAGPVDFTVNVLGATIPSIRLAANTAAAGCAPATSSGSGGGSTSPTTYTLPEFTTGTLLDPPPNIGFEGVEYTFTFEATGDPDPTFALDSDAPDWLEIDEKTGVVSGKPKTGTTSFVYTVLATNALNNPAHSGPWTVTVTPPTIPPVSGSSFGGPYELDDEPVSLAPAVPQSQTNAPAAPSSITLPPPSALILPNGRGEIQLPADVTPAVSIFTYTETDSPTAALGNLVFAGLDFTLAAVDSASGAPVTALVDAPRAAITFRAEELRSARITDPARLSLYWWSGTAWVNQMPCASCGYNSSTQTLTVALSHVGEYALAAVPAPTPTLTITAVPISAVIGVPFSGIVASFPPGDPLDGIDQYAATITWGDGQMSSGEIFSSSGMFTVRAGHVWNSTGTYLISITVFDVGMPRTVQVTAIVSPPTTPPQFTAFTPPLTATQGTMYSYAFAASGTPTPTFALGAGAPAWLSIGPTTGVVIGTPPAGITSFTYSVIASNGVAPTATAGPFAVAVTPLQTPPQFTAATPPLTATQGSPYSYTFAATGVPTPAFALVPGAPSWLSIGTSTGVVSGTPPSGTTTFTYAVVASNGLSPDAGAGPFAVTVNSTSNNPADLAVTIGAPATATKGSTVTYSIIVTNNGPSTATNGALVLLAGPGATFVSASPNVFINLDGLWTWTFAKLDAGQSASFTLRLKLTKAGTVLATAAVGADTRDPKLANNAALVRTTVK